MQLEKIERIQVPKSHKCDDYFEGKMGSFREPRRLADQVLELILWRFVICDEKTAAVEG